MSEIAWIWTWPTIDCELLVSKSVEQVFTKYRQGRLWPERGGQLFVDPKSPNGLILAKATNPHHSDKAGRFWLDMDPSRCKSEIESANKKGLRLVGYWHTHPQTIPVISSIDLESFRRFSTQYNQKLPCPIAVIVGTSVKPSGIKVWSFRQGSYHEGIYSHYTKN